MNDLSFMSDAIETAIKYFKRASAKHSSHFPHVTDEKGNWQRLDPSIGGYWDEQGWHHGHWTGGFWPGMLWIAYDLTKQEEFRKRAERDIVHFLSRTQDTSTHDIGFLIYPTFGLGYELTGEESYKQAILQAADTLLKRYVSSGGYLTAWGLLEESRSAGTTAIDTMMNLPLLFHAWHLSGNDVYRDVSIKHAQTTASHYVEPDGRTYHIITFDQFGEPVQKGTYQGFSADSCWSRGLSWAISGFAFTYRETMDTRFLNIFEQTLNYYLSHVDESMIPRWDFADDRQEAWRDSSAAAITSYGLLVMSSCHSDLEKRDHYKALAIRILRNLSLDYLNKSDDRDGLLLHSCYSVPHGEGVDSATVFGDFYYLLAMNLLYKISLYNHFFA